MKAKTFYQWCEDDGPVLWWTYPVSEPPYAGTPSDDTFPGYHTHWTPIDIPTEFDKLGKVLIEIDLEKLKDPLKIADVVHEIYTTLYGENPAYPWYGKWKHHYNDVAVATYEYVE